MNNKISGVRGIESKKNLFLFFTSVERNHRVGLVKVFVSVKQTRKNYNSKIDNKKKKRFVVQFSGVIFIQSSSGIRN